MLIVARVKSIWVRLLVCLDIAVLTFDADKAIKFTGRYLTCGGHIGSGGMDLDKYNEDKGK